MTMTLWWELCSLAWPFHGIVWHVSELPLDFMTDPLQLTILTMGALCSSIITPTASSRATPGMVPHPARGRDVLGVTVIKRHRRLVFCGVSYSMELAEEHYHDGLKRGDLRIGAGRPVAAGPIWCHIDTIELMKSTN